MLFRSLVFPVWWNGVAVLTIAVGYVIKTKKEEARENRGIEPKQEDVLWPR